MSVGLFGEQSVANIFGVVFEEVLRRRRVGVPLILPGSPACAGRKVAREMEASVAFILECL